MDRAVAYMFGCPTPTSRFADTAQASKGARLSLKQDTADAADFYTRVATEFDASYERDPNRRERLRVWNAFLTRHANGAELAYDLGCGSGAVTFELARYASRVIGIDAAHGMLKIACQRAANRGLTGRVQFSESRLPIAGQPDLEPADVVVSSSAVEYMDSIPQTLTFMHKILNPDGRLILSMTNRASVSRRLARLVYRLAGRPRYFRYIRHFVTAGELEAYLRGAGFLPLEFAYFESADWLNRVLRAFLPRRLASNMIIAVAQRLPSVSPDAGPRPRA